MYVVPVCQLPRPNGGEGTSCAPWATRRAPGRPGWRGHRGARRGGSACAAGARPLGSRHRALLQPLGQDPHAGAVPAKVPATPPELRARRHLRHDAGTVRRGTGRPGHGPGGGPFRPVPPGSASGPGPGLGPCRLSGAGMTTECEPSLEDSAPYKQHCTIARETGTHTGVWLAYLQLGDACDDNLQAN